MTRRHAHRVGDAPGQSRRRCGAAARPMRSKREANSGSAPRRAVEAGRIRVLTPYRIRSIANGGEALRVTGAVRDEDDQRRCRSGDRLHRLPSRSRDAERSAAWHRSVARMRLGTRAADRSQRTQLRHRASARRPRARASRERFLHRRHEELWPRADVPAGDRIRAGAIGGRDARGDVAAAERVELVLPETGVCSTDLQPALASLLRRSRRPKTRMHAASTMRSRRRKERAAAAAARASPRCSRSEYARRRDAPSGDLGDRLRSAGQLGRPVFRLQRPAGPAQEAFDAPRWLVAGAFSLGLLVSAVAAPAVGRLADRGQGPAVMQAGGLLAAGLLILWALVPTMLDDLRRLGGARPLHGGDPLRAGVRDRRPRLRRIPKARLRAIATVTVTGGLASTAFLPGTSALVDATRLARRGGRPRRSSSR